MASVTYRLVVAIATGLMITSAAAQQVGRGPITVPSDRTPAVLLGPTMLDPEQARIGQIIEDVALHDLNGQTKSLYQLGGRLGTVIVVRDPQCPVSRRYGPRIADLAERFRASGIRFVYIYPSESLRHEQRLVDRRSLATDGFFGDRGSFALANLLGVISTGDTFVLDEKYRLRYRGAVDDQYGLGYTRDIPTRNYLRNALDALSQNEVIEVPATSAPGCYIDADPALDHLFDDLPNGHMAS